MSVAETGSPGKRLRQAWEAQTIAVPGVFCPLVARMAQRLGFSAVYLSGAALSASLGLPDIGLLGASELIGRWLFFVTVVPTNMPGAFWRGMPTGGRGRHARREP